MAIETHAIITKQNLPSLDIPCQDHDTHDIHYTHDTQLRERFYQYDTQLRERFKSVYCRDCGKAAIAAMMLFVALAVSLLTRPGTQTTS